MKTTPKKSKPIWLFIALGLVVTVIFTYLIRGWIRVTAMAKFTSFTYGRSVANVGKKQLNATGDPLSLLGYTNIDQKQSGDCKLQSAKRFSTQYECRFEYTAYNELSQLDVDSKTLNSNAQKLMTTLKSNGWTGEYGTSGDYTSLSTLVGNLTKGIDYTPDAYYEKDFGSIKCMFDTSTAFSKPKPPAFSSTFMCVKTVNFFGTPPLEPTPFEEDL